MATEHVKNGKYGARIDLNSLIFRVSFIDLYKTSLSCGDGCGRKKIYGRSISSNFLRIAHTGCFVSKRIWKGSVSTTKNSPKEKREYRISENLHFHISGSKLLTFHNFIFHALQNAKIGEVNFVNNFT